MKFMTFLVLAAFSYVCAAYDLTNSDFLSVIDCPSGCLIIEWAGKKSCRDYITGRSCKTRVTRDVNVDKKIGDGKIFGTLGGDDSSLYGKAGYKGVIFNDERGRLAGEAYGARVLGASGDTSHYGGKLDWANRDALASLDVNRQIGGRTSMTASGGGAWNLDKNTRLSAEAMYSRQFGGGRPDYGVFANFHHRF